MNPDLNSFKTNPQHFPFWENTLDQNAVTYLSRNSSFNNPKIERFLNVLYDSGIDRSVIKHLSDFFRCLIRRNRRIKTIQLYFYTLKQFFLFIKLLDINRLELIDRDQIGAFIELLQDQDFAPSTVNTYLIILYTFFRFLVGKNVISSDILKNKFRLKMPDLLPRAIDPSDIKQLLSAIDTVRERALVTLLLRTGMRIGELLGTKIVDINLTEKKIEIPQAQKNCEGRIVYMSDDACIALKTWLQQRLSNHEYVFYGRWNHQPLSYASARVLFIKCLKKAGLSDKGYTLHCLRHTYASELLNAGMRLECLQVLLGHQDIEVTRRYARLTDNTRKQEYFKAMDRIERGEIDGHYRFHN